MFRWYHNDLPNVFCNVFTAVSNIHEHHTRQNKHLYCEINTDLGRTKLSYKGPYVWNQIMKININPNTSEAVFVKAVKQCIKVGIF